MKFEPHSVTFTVDSVYKNINLENRLNEVRKNGLVPTGEFRPPRHGETYLTSYGARDVYSGNALDYYPRIILREAKKVKVVTFKHTGEKRNTCQGEWAYYGDSLMPYYQQGGEVSKVYGEIVIREEHEELE